MINKSIGTLAIGAAGELLVQYQLLKHGINSARLTTDSGIDLVMYLPGQREAATIQVKAKLDTITAYGGGKRTMGMTFPEHCEAQWLAGADIGRDMVWLFPIERARALAQQRNAGSCTLYWFIDNSTGRVTRPERDFDEYRLDAIASHLLAGESFASEGSR